MAITTILTSDPISTWVSKTNTLSTNVGDASLLTGTLVTNINTLDSNLGTRTSLGTTDKTDIVSAINELETAIRGTGSNYTLTTSATNLVSAINEHETLINTLNDSIGSGGLNTTATTLVGAINEHETQINSTVSNTTTNTSNISTINTNIGTIGSLTTSASNLVGAINEHETQINTNITIIGSASLNTAATTLTAAINELVSDLSDLDSDKSATLTSTINDLGDLDSDVGTRTSLNTNDKSSLVAAINEVNTAQSSFNEASEIRAIFSATDNGGDGSFSYNSSTGAFSYTGPSASEVRAHFTAGTGIDITNGTISADLGTSISSSEFVSKTTLLIKNSSGTTVKTMYSPGS